jgi:hypothetical protein
MTVHKLNPDREAFLDGRDKGLPVTVPAWPREDKDLPKVELEVDWVRFSVLNHRTKAEQLSYAQKVNRPDLFWADPLGKAAQEAQYEILKGQEGFELLKADLLKRPQQEPAIITADGILINGNRRAAALRSLYEEGNPDKKYIKCLILPKDATVEEMFNLEAELQVANDFKQEYAWINDALMIEYFYDRDNKNWDLVAARLHRKPGDIRSQYEKLLQVRQLVEMSQGARDYKEFIDNESAFDELAKHIKNKPDAEAEAVKSVYFMGILAGNEYRRLRHLRRPDAAELVMTELESNEAVAPILEAADKEFGQTADDGDPLDDLLGDPVIESPLKGVLALVARRRNSSTVPLSDGAQLAMEDLLSTLNNSISAAADEAEEEQKDKTTATAPKDRVEKALKELTRARDVLPKAQKFDDFSSGDLKAQLNQVDSVVAAIRDLLDQG